MIKIKQKNSQYLSHLTMTLSVILFFGLFLLLSACDEAGKEPVIEEISESVKPKIPEVVREDPDDSSSYDMPRFQFKGTLKGRDEYEVWSMKIDGTDLRLAISAEELYAKGYSDLGLHTRRSPDGRYVLLVQQPDKGMNSRVLYNIKTHERTTIIKNGAVNPSIRWLEDSKNVLFYSWSDDDSKANLYLYNVETKKLTTRPIINSYEFYPVKKDSEFVAMSKEGFEIYNWKGKVIKEKIILFDKIHTRNHSVSRNGKVLVYQRGKYPYGYFVINILFPDTIVYSKITKTQNLILTYTGKFLYYIGKGGVIKVDILNKNQSIIIPFIELDYFETFGQLQLYNDIEH